MIIVFIELAKVEKIDYTDGSKIKITAFQKEKTPTISGLPWMRKITSISMSFLRGYPWIFKNQDIHGYP